MNIYNFICVNYNGSHFCHDLLKSLELINVDSGHYVRFYIVDNSSKLKDIKALRKLSSNKVELVLMELPNNIGYFPAMNVGIKKANSDNDGLIIIGNNDLEYSTNFITSYNSLVDVPKDTIVISPDVVTTDGVHQNPLSLSKLSKSRLIIEEIYYSNYYISRAMIFIRGLYPKQKKIKPVQSEQMVIQRGIGACYILQKTFFDFYDKLDDRVFMWGEEVLLSNQVESVGKKILFCPSLKVHHFESGTVKKIASKNRYEMVRKSFQIYKKYL
ncbi:glycosyltransferase family 2 protein [Colwellia sp. BRX8-7]|uniref:glycosyltransferase n=1 Tax=Colwellia sp. BRX8-7 TaxID=2759833 RepID=UPI0015F4AFD0|nr:glycosyltransferase [Colwellia sp. BRX8-7]MBA6335675.1 glycosyltransferase family 2 protein [Colwellia sp. BRX8-7]